LAKIAADAIDNILMLRNTIAHGHVLPAGVGGGLLNNPRWHGEERKKETQDLHLSEQTMSLILNATFDLIQFMALIIHSPLEPFNAQ